MPIIVHKYGGSSVADIDKIKRVAAKVVDAKTRGYDVVVVVSAMGDTTDELLALARRINPSPDARELDMLVSVGERISMALVSMAIHELGHRAISFTGSQSGIITNTTQGAARIIQVRPYRIQDELSRGNIVIVAGYQGSSYRGEITTLGRGGSDTTAVALAVALGAEACEIYSDVDGVYSADPRVVTDAQKIEALATDEMQELARLGARVLNADAVEFARRAGIALYAKATAGGGEGTIIRPDGFPDVLLKEERAAWVSGVAGRKDLILVRYSSAADRSVDLLSLLETADLLYAATEPNSVLAVLSAENVHGVEAFVARLSGQLGEGLVATTGLGLASAVGHGVGNRTRAQARLLRALAEAGISPQLSFSTRTAISAVVQAAQVDAAVNALHREFVG